MEGEVIIEGQPTSAGLNLGETDLKKGGGKRKRSKCRPAIEKKSQEKVTVQRENERNERQESFLNSEEKKSRRQTFEWRLLVKKKKRGPLGELKKSMTAKRVVSEVANEGN